MAKLGGIQQGILQQGGLSFLGAQQGLLPTLASKYQSQRPESAQVLVLEMCMLTNFAKG